MKTRQELKTEQRWNIFFGVEIIVLTFFTLGMTYELLSWAGIEGQLVDFCFLMLGLFSMMFGGYLVIEGSSKLHDLNWEEDYERKYGR